MQNISLWCMRISQNLFLLNLSEIFLAPFPSFFWHYFLLFTSFLLAKKVWTKSLENPEKETMINCRCLFEHRFCTQNGSRFSLISSVRMQPIFKMNNSVERSILVLSAVYHKNPLTCKLMTSQVVQWPRLQIATRSHLRVKGLRIIFIPNTQKSASFYLKMYTLCLLFWNATTYTMPNFKRGPLCRSQCTICAFLLKCHHTHWAFISDPQKKNKVCNSKCTLFCLSSEMPLYTLSPIIILDPKCHLIH